MAAKKKRPKPSGLSVEDARVVKLFDRFATSGFAKTRFTKPLYRALMHAFGFIAHYDLSGFYEARFATLAARHDTLFAMSIDEFGHELTPLEQALRTLVLDRGLFVSVQEEVKVVTEKAERAELARLKAKYEQVGRR